MDLAILLILIIGFISLFIVIKSLRIVDTSKYDCARIDWAHRERDLRSQIGSLEAEIRYNHLRIKDLEQDIDHLQKSKDNADSALLSFITLTHTQG